MRSLLLLALLSLFLLAKCEKLSTVFVLETSDSTGSSYNNNNHADVSNTGTGSGPGSSSSSSSSNARESKMVEEPSTRIITDNSDPISRAPSPQQQSTSSQQQQHSTSQSQLNKQSALEEHQSNQEQHQKPITRSTQVQHNQASQNKPKQSTTTTTTESYYNEREKSYNNNNNHNNNPGQASGTPPNSEERLLISITHNDEEDSYGGGGVGSVNNKPPKKTQTGSSISSGGYDEGSSQSSSQLQVNQQPKRKPSITISIQDGNLKHDGSSGSSGTPAVIVRPSENGQSIVISTVGISGNKLVNKPPGISILGPNSDHVEIPVHGHQPASTHRPQISNNNDYLPSANRPLTSTLVDQPVRPVSISDERPQRPPVGPSEYDREPSRPITQRPSSRPPPQQQEGNYGNGNGNNDLENSNSQLASQSGEPRYPLNDKNCGLPQETRIVGGDEANPDDYLWMAAIIKSKPSGDGEARPFCGGSLITRRHILTAAHCLENLAPRDVLVRLGSYDFDDSTASSLSADYAIDQFRVPGHYSKKTHSADIAIMRLKTPLSTSDNYKTVCMPQSRRSYVGALGTVTGYGSQSQTFRKAAPKLRQVTVPIWENRKCSVVYKKNLTESYLCAGYEEGGKDACQGDSGGPLMTMGPNERMMVVGVVSHGIGCGSPGYPGVYTRTTTFLEWIEKNTRE